MERLTALNDSLIESWVDVVDVDDLHLCFRKPQLCMDFRLAEKAVLLY